MEKIKFTGLDIQVVTIDGEVYVPIKFFIDDYKLDFNQTMMWFNNLGYSEKLDTVMEYIDKDNYLCFYIEDFSYFLTVLSVREKKFFKPAMEIASLYSKKFMDKEYRNDILKFITENYRVPETTDDKSTILFMTSSEILEEMPVKIIEDIDNVKIGFQMRYLKFRKTTHYVNGGSKYGYSFVRIVK